MAEENNKATGCPLPLSNYPRILLAHGGGGRLMHQLIDEIFRASFDNPDLETGHDGAILGWSGNKLVFTTDSYVVDPLFFPGGDIGMLAVYGTVNDLAMCGARPRYLSASFIIEEGLPVETLRMVAESMHRAAVEAGIAIVTGDTKVVEHGHGHGVFINTAGAGSLEHDRYIHPSKVVPGDVVIINGDIGRHGIAVMSAREGMQFETEIESDLAPLAATVARLMENGVEIHCLRDLTRGGLATGLIEIAQTGKVSVVIEEKSIPVSGPVRGACEMLGYDPLYIANEGRFVCLVPEKDSGRTIEIMRSLSWPATIIGRVGEGQLGLVTMIGAIGAERIIDMLSGEQLPRIC
nr:hydrogenase expression/formation protein HypE [candidate division Zixibacteria bacterium]